MQRLLQKRNMRGKDRAMIHTDRMIREFSHLVSLDSESYEERPVKEYVSARLKELGLEVREDMAAEKLRPLAAAAGRDAALSAGNLYAWLPAYPEANQVLEPLLFSAHMDTVSPGKGKRAVMQEDGRITSEGTTVLGADDLAAVSEYLEMLTVIREQNLAHPPLEFVFSVAEEPYCRGAAAADSSMLKAKQGYVFDMSSPVGMAATAAPIILSFGITVKGRASHAGFSPESGIHAIRIAALAISRMHMGHEDPETTVNIGVIKGGVQRNVVPEEVTAGAEIRSLDNEKAYHVWEEVQRLFREAAAEVSAEAEVDFTCEEMFPAYRIPLSSPVVRRFEQAAERLGITTKFMETYGGSDANVFNGWGIEMLVVSSAMEKCHSCREETSVQAMTRAAELALELAVMDGRKNQE